LAENPFEETEQENITKAHHQNQRTDCLNIYNFHISRCFDALQEIGEQSSKQPLRIEKSAVYMILTRITGLMQSVKALTLMGYYYEALILERSFWEALGLCWYLFSNQDAAEKWHNGKEIEISSFKLFGEIQNFLERKLKKKTLNSVYGRFCTFVHSDAPAILSLALKPNPKQKESASGLIVGKISFRVPSEFDNKKVEELAILPFAVLLLIGRIFHDELPPEIKNEINHIRDLMNEKSTKRNTGASGRYR
jgi:hypothetical protein